MHLHFHVPTLQPCQLYHRAGGGAARPTHRSADTCYLRRAFSKVLGPKAATGAVTAMFVAFWCGPCPSHTWRHPPRALKVQDKPMQPICPPASHAPCSWQ